MDGTSSSFLCFECPRCHDHNVGIRDYPGGEGFMIVCGWCKMVFLARFNGEMWIFEQVEDLRSANENDYE